jgi:hypothetical protein
MRYALYTAEDYVQQSRRNGSPSGWPEALERYPLMFGDPPFPINLPFIAAEVAHSQAEAAAALAHAKRNAQALHRAMQQKACTEWPAGVGKEVVRFACTLRIRDPAWGDSGHFVQSDLDGSPTRLVLFERAIQFSALSESPPGGQSVIPAQLLNLALSTPPDKAGNLAFILRAEYPTGIGVGFRDRYQLRTDQCGPMTEAEIGRADVAVRDWFESLAR